MGPAREVVTKPLIDRLYQTDVDILHAPATGPLSSCPADALTKCPPARRPWRVGLSHTLCQKETA